VARRGRLHVTTRDLVHGQRDGLLVRSGAGPECVEEPGPCRCRRSPGDRRPHRAPGRVRRPYGATSLLRLPRPSAASALGEWPGRRPIRGTPAPESLREGRSGSAPHHVLVLAQFSSWPGSGTRRPPSMTSRAGLSRNATVACEKARDAVQRFVEVECKRRGKAAVHAMIAKLERKPRDAEAKLRSKPTETAPASKAEPMNQRGNHAVIRAWCVCQGIEVPRMGRLPRDAVEAHEVHAWGLKFRARSSSRTATTRSTWPSSKSR
jgi:hypothetical protein